MLKKLLSKYYNVILLSLASLIFIHILFIKPILLYGYPMGAIFDQLSFYNHKFEYILILLLLILAFLKIKKPKAMFFEKIISSLCSIFGLLGLLYSFSIVYNVLLYNYNLSGQVI